MTRNEGENGGTGARELRPIASRLGEMTQFYGFRAPRVREIHCASFKTSLTPS